MKAVGSAILVFVVLALSGDAVVAVGVGLLAGVLVWQIDRLGARIRVLEQGQRVRDAVEGAPSAAVPTPDFAPPPPAPAAEVTYRVLSFVALGILLLGAAYLYSRFQPAAKSPA